MSKRSADALEAVSMWCRDVNDLWQTKTLNAIGRLKKEFLDKKTWKAPIDIHPLVDLEERKAHAAAWQVDKTYLVLCKVFQRGYKVPTAFLEKLTENIDMQNAEHFIHFGASSYLTYVNTDELDKRLKFTEACVIGWDDNDNAEDAEGAETLT
jgi:hypothetical protein